MEPCTRFCRMTVLHPRCWNFAYPCFDVRRKGVHEGFDLIDFGRVASMSMKPTLVTLLLGGQTSSSTNVSNRTILLDVQSMIMDHIEAYKP